MIADRFADAVDALVDRIGALVAGLVLVLVLLIAGNTLARYFFNASTLWLQELEWHLLAVIALWGIAYLQLRGSQVRVDMFYQHFSPATKRRLELATLLLVSVPFSAFVVYLSWRFVAHSWSLNEVSPDPGGLPARWLVKSLVLSGYALLGLAALSQAIRLLRDPAAPLPGAPEPVVLPPTEARDGA